MREVYCTTCRAKQKYYISWKHDSMSVRDISFSYMELVANCVRCKQKVYVPKVNDANVSIREQVYKVALDLASDE